MKIIGSQKIASKLRPIINNIAQAPAPPEFPRLFIRQAPVYQQPSAFSLKVRDAITYLMEHCGFISWR